MTRPYLDVYCEGCGVAWNPVGGFYHTLGCEYHPKQPPDCPTISREDYTDPLSEYDKGWNDAVGAMMEVLEDMTSETKLSE